MLDSAAMTKDLSTGVPPSSVGRSDSFLHTDILYNTHSDIPLPSHAGRVFNMTSNTRPMHHLPTYTLHPVLESKNRYGILFIDDTNDEPTDSSPKWGITVGPHMNEDTKDDEARLPQDVHIEVGLNPATQPANHLASSSL